MCRSVMGRRTMCRPTACLTGMSPSTTCWTALGRRPPLRRPLAQRPGRRSVLCPNPRQTPRTGTSAGTRTRTGAGTDPGLLLVLLGPEQRLRHDQHGLHATVDIGLQPNHDPVPTRELRHHEQPDTAVLQQTRDVHLVRIGEQRVHPVLLGQRHPEPAILDLDGQPRGDHIGPQQDLGVRRREHRRVLDEFGQQVDHVRDGVPAHSAVDGRDELDPRVLLDLGDRGAQHLGHGDRVAPLPTRDGPAQHGEVLGVAPDPGGEVVDVEQTLEQVRILDLVLQLVEDRDLAVHEGLQAPRQVDEDLDLLFAARVAGELGRLDDRADGSVVGARQVVGEQVELVCVRGGSGARSARGRHVAAAQRLDEGAQIGLAPGAGAAQRADAFAYGPGGAVGGHGGDHDARESDRDGSAEHDPQGEAGRCGGRADGEEHGGAGTEGDRDGRQDREAEELGPYLGLGQRGGGAGDRSPVPPALAAVCACGRCAKVRHRRPRTGVSGCGAPAGAATKACADWGIRHRCAGRESRGIRPCVAQRPLTVVASASCPVGS